MALKTATVADNAVAPDKYGNKHTKCGEEKAQCHSEDLGLRGVFNVGEKVNGSSDNGGDACLEIYAYKQKDKAGNIPPAVFLEKSLEHRPPSFQYLL